MKFVKSSLAELKRLQAERTAWHKQQQRAPTQTGRPAARTPASDAAPASDADTRAQTPDQPVQPPLNASDLALFRRAMRLVEPLPKRDARIHVRAQRAPEHWLLAKRTHAQGQALAGSQAETLEQSAQALKPALLDLEAGHYLRAGCGTDVLRDLRRGKWPVQASLDLHGSTQEQALERLDNFLRSCLEHALRCVRIIHGKGIGSRSGAPVLKAVIRQHLSHLPEVQAWAQSPARDGGAGAVTVLLKVNK